MSKSINRVELQGRVGTVRISPCVGAVAANFSLLTEHQLRSALGVAIVESTWHNVAAFEGGDVYLEGLARGSMAHLTGRLRTSKYTTADGIERMFTEVVADTLKVLEENDNND